MRTRTVLVCAVLAWSAIAAGCMVDPADGPPGAAKPSADPDGESTDPPPGTPVVRADAGTPDPDGCRQGTVSWKGCTSHGTLEKLAKVQCGAMPVSLEVVEDCCPAGEGEVAHFRCCPSPGGDPPPPEKCETIVIGPYDACLNDDLLLSRAAHACEGRKRSVTELSPDRACSGAGSLGARVVCCAFGDTPPPPPPPTTCEARSIEIGGCVPAALLQDNAATRCSVDGLRLGEFVADAACGADGSSSAVYTCCSL